ncbi:CvpA family protein [Rickettsiella endosymbiont of Aleochara curtula]|jgi:uncharacterized membrane protein required for colicin V production|uniref:CvpA family protein n=1 Tax=Rickettsiella endosymbiont of Aleochara curtula TaxID=3077936 RepID=UPI003CC7ADD4
MQAELNWMDGVIVIMLCLSVTSSVVRGLRNFFYELGTLVLLFFIPLYAIPFFKDFQPSNSTIFFISGIFLLGLSWRLWNSIRYRKQNSVQLSCCNRTLSGILGLIRGILLVELLVFIICSINRQSLHGSLLTSYFFSMLNKLPVEKILWIVWVTPLYIFFYLPSKLF